MRLAGKGGRGRKKSRTPIGRELSENWHVLEVQMHCPATGSQKGVEQFVGTDRSMSSELKRKVDERGESYSGNGLVHRQQQTVRDLDYRVMVVWRGIRTIVNAD
jgi:hypothetical protein